MLPVEPKDEPSDFSSRVGDKGEKWLSENATGTPPAHWTEMLNELRDSYDQTCNYFCIRIDSHHGRGSVDHYLPKGRAQYRQLAYEWSNYRYAERTANQRKGDHLDVIDPFDVQDGWFVIDPFTLKIKPGSGVDDATRGRVRKTICRLKLNAPEHIRSRKEMLANLLNSDWSAAALAEAHRFLAHEVNRWQAANEF